jgi:hypothetical protein
VDRQFNNNNLPYSPLFLAILNKSMENSSYKVVLEEIKEQRKRLEIC